jgi:uncharacterized protein YceK
MFPSDVHIYGRRILHPAQKLCTFGGVIGMKSLMTVIVAGLTLAGCGYIAEHTVARKAAATTRSAEALRADELFWATFHGGKYEQIQPALEAETTAYLANPHDAVSASHVAWLHIWRLSERARLASVPASISDDALLAQGYFAEALDMNPKEARYRGFLASATLIEGHLNQDERVTRRGYYTMLNAINAWPEFNLFTAGYVMSTQPATSERFRQALGWQWRDLDVCVGEKFDRNNPDISKYMQLQTQQGPKRACWNSWIAPHNFEGFFLNMGDMLVKAGDWQTAQRMYSNAKFSSTYAQWPYRQALEERIRDARGNVTAFNASANADGSEPRRIMIDSVFSCMACHQQ